MLSNVGKEKIFQNKVISARVYPEFFSFNKDRVLNVGAGLGPQAFVYRDQYSEMIGVDINEERLLWSEKKLLQLGVDNYKTLHANAENISLPDGSFDKVIAIDIIEHVQSPKKMIKEVWRLLKHNGEVLITFPIMWEKYISAGRFLRKTFLIKKTINIEKYFWVPDEHNHKFSINQWLNIVESCNFDLVKLRATTMFPPLHRLGIPRFWFSNGFIHSIDKLFCSTPWIKKYGSTIMAVFKKT